MTGHGFGLLAGVALVALWAGPGVCSAGPRAAKPPERLRLETTEIKGHEGLPRVLYIVPWKRAAAGDPRGRPASSLLDDVIAPVDRAEFRRELRYQDDLKSESGTEKVR